MNEVSRGILYPALAVLLAGLISVGLVDAVQADQMEGFDGGNGQMSPERRGGEELYRNQISLWVSRLICCLAATVCH